MEFSQEQDDDGILTVRMDDGDKNALGIEAFATLERLLDDAEATAIVLAGRDGIFSAGLDVKFLADATRAEVRELLVVFGRAVMRLWTEPTPTVCAATGHAIAAGTMLSMCCDHSVAADGDFRWGLTETRIDFEMPRFGLALARHNVRNDRVDDLILPGAVLGADTAVEVGYADELAPPDEVLARARARAAELAELPAAAYAGTKQRLRGDTAADILDGLGDDLDEMLAAYPPEGRG